ncbi:hypothetical protein F5Y07DRAFT_131145 [Xylaria sp. FL0933]|nr:hypothetical protein F5Y07DRAFT_131145 [Xylaria sp. FL0933]
MSLAVHLVEYRGSPRNHHALFIPTGKGGGQLFHVIGSVHKGMRYETRPSKAPSLSVRFISSRQIGWVSNSALGQVDDICRSNPPPEQQIDAGTLINENKRLRRCQEWTAETIYMLEEAGVMTPVSGGASTSGSGGMGGQSRHTTSSQSDDSHPGHHHSSSRYGNRNYTSTSSTGGYYATKPGSHDSYYLNTNHTHGQNTSTSSTYTTKPGSYDSYYSNTSHTHGQRPVDGETSGDGYWKWSESYGDWYHLHSDGRTTWSQQSGSSSKGKRR